LDQGEKSEASCDEPSDGDVPMMDGDGETAPAEMLALARKLYTRRATGTVVPYKQLDSNHTEGQCHQNAGIWASDNAGWKVVHGWLVFDFERDTLGLVPLVWFNPHSVVEDPTARVLIQRPLPKRRSDILS
jgi:hypothetical protein